MHIHVINVTGEQANEWWQLTKVREWSTDNNTVVSSEQTSEQGSTGMDLSVNEASSGERTGQ
jgi:hypothetical protein